MHEWIAAKYHGLILHLIDYIIVDGNSSPHVFKSTTYPPGPEISTPCSPLSQRPCL